MPGSYQASAPRRRVLNRFFFIKVTRSDMPNEPIVVVYGLSTEGYAIANQIARRGSRVFIIDEMTSSAIALEPEIAHTYPTVLALREDEPLLAVKSIEETISDAQYLFFAPTVRKTGHDVKGEIRAKFKDAVSPLKEGSSVIYCVPVGFGENEESADLLMHVTGFEVGRSVSYYYYPLPPKSSGVIGVFDGKDDEVLASLLGLEAEAASGRKTLASLLGEARPRRRFVTIAASECFHAIDTLSRLARVASILEVCKIADDEPTRESLMSSDLRDLYLDDMLEGVYDLHSLGSSFEGVSTIKYLINGSARVIDGYSRILTDAVKGVLKNYELKASRTRLLLLWTLDQDSMRGDKIEMRQNFVVRMRDHIGDVSTQEDLGFDHLHDERTTIVICCTKSDFENAIRYRGKGKLVYIKANPICEVVR